MTGSLDRLLRAAAERCPEAPAVSCGDGHLTYGELATASDRVAAWLRAEGVRRGDRVALYLPKSMAAVVAVYGALKAGAAYVPIDCFAPARRAAFILRDCEVRHVVAAARPLQDLLRLPAGSLPPVRLLATEPLGDGVASTLVTPWASLSNLPTSPEAGPADIRADDLAYILYTSGSTGEPKGVAISHRAALSFVRWAVETFELRGDDCLSSHAPLHFDLSIFDLFGAAAVGGSVVLIPESVLPFPARVAELIEKHGFSVWYSVPWALVQLLRAGGLQRRNLGRLRLVLFAGEVFPVAALRELMAQIPGARFWNLYGPTETNVCTYYEVPALDPDRTSPVPIGRPCAYADVVAVDRDGHRIQAGETGELLVGGPSLMGGYWQRPELTAEVLVPHPCAPDGSGPVYRTGDLVRLEPDGTYTFVGRRDHMIKLRGYRIDLGEIEAVLSAHPGVAEVAVVLDTDPPPTQRLVAVVALRADARMSGADLQRHCAEHLPRYMVPQAVEIRPALPRTTTGKIDRPALGALMGGAGATSPAP